jgi:hypothetical protein
MWECELRMSAKSVLEKWSREQIQRAPYTGVDSYGQRVYGASIPFRARIDHTTKLTRDAQGEQRVSVTQVYLATTEVIHVLDRITLPDGSTPLLLRVERLADHKGVLWCTVLYF